MSYGVQEIKIAIMRAEKVQKDYLSSIKETMETLHELNKPSQNHLGVLKNLKMLCINGYKSDFYMRNPANIRFKLSDSAEFTKFKEIENSLINLTNAISGTLSLFGKISKDVESRSLAELDSMESDSVLELGAEIEPGEGSLELGAEIEPGKTLKRGSTAEVEAIPTKVKKL